MSQMARTDDHKPVAEIKVRDNGAANTERGSAHQGRDLAHDAAEKTASGVERGTAKSAAAVERVTHQARSLAAAAPEIGNEFAGFWSDLMTAQMAHNAEAFRRMAAASDWQERFAIQNSYATGNLARMTEAASRWTEITGTMVARLMATGGLATNKAGRAQ